MRKQTNENIPKEKLTPEQIWKNASMVLGTKKKEHDTYTRVDLRDINNSITKIMYERTQHKSKDEFMKHELRNSLFHIPQFNNKHNTYTYKVSWYPRYQLSTFSSPDIYKKLELDTLFFIFYSNPSTEHQYYAATQLKLCSWRFHTKYCTWFQRLEEPKLITADYERGDFLFFDYDVTWSFMKKSDFTFEYKYLECTEL